MPGDFKRPTAREDDDGTLQRRASSAAPRGDRGTTVGGGNGVAIKFPDGKQIALVRNTDGTEAVRGHIPAEWMEAASICGYYKKDTRGRSTGEVDGAAYALEQLHIEEDRREGRSTGLRMGNSETWQ